MIPDLLIQADQSTHGPTDNPLSRHPVLVDFKTLGCGDCYLLKDPSRATATREKRVLTEYLRKARNLDQEHNGTAPGQPGPVEKRLRSFGPPGEPVLGLIVGAFGELSDNFLRVRDLIVEPRLRQDLQFLSTPVSVLKGRLIQQLNCEWGCLAHFGWARLVLRRAFEEVCLSSPGFSHPDPSVLDEHWSILQDSLHHRNGA